MTTNSHNPVDGDVQALIEYCEHVLHGSNNGSPMEQVYKIALASLTAEPADRIVDDGCSQRIGCVPVSDTLNCTWPLGTQFYTTPPAQLLRPVELPEFVYDPEGEPFLHRDEVAELLRSLGHEVK